MPSATSTKKPDKRSGASQHARFLEAAREAGADVDTDAADRLMGTLAKTKPEPKPAKKAVIASKARPLSKNEQP